MPRGPCYSLHLVSGDEQESGEHEDRGGWITRAEVAQRTGKTISAIRFGEKRGDFICEKKRINGHEVVLFDPNQFEEEPPPDGDPQAAFMHGLGKTFADLAGLCKQAYDQQRQIVKECFELMAKFATDTNAQLGEVCKNQQQQLTDLQKSNFEMRQQYEKSLSEEHERILATDMLRSEERRKEKRWNDVAPVLQQIASQLAKDKLGLDLKIPPPGESKEPAPAAPAEKPAPPPATEPDQVIPWRDLLLTMTLEQAQKLIESGEFDAGWLQSQAYALRTRFEACKTIEEILGVSTDVEAMIGKLTDKQREVLRGVLDDDQRQLLDYILKNPFPKVSTDA